MMSIERGRAVILGVDYQGKQTHACLHGALPGVPW